MKLALVTPLLKKPSMDPEVLGNFRPISNLPFLSKLLERVVARQLIAYDCDCDCDEVYLSLCNQRTERITRQRLPCLRCWMISWLLSTEVKLSSLLCWTRALHSIRLIMIFYLIVWRHDLWSLAVFLLGLSRISSIEGSQSVLRESRPVLFFCLLVFLKDPFWGMSSTPCTTALFMR